MSVSQSNSSTNKAANQSRGGRWQFGLFTTVMLMTALALAIEKPIRKYRASQKLTESISKISILVKLNGPPIPNTHLRRLVGLTRSTFLEKLKRSD